MASLIPFLILMVTAFFISQLAKANMATAYFIIVMTIAGAFALKALRAK